MSAFPGESELRPSRAFPAATNSVSRRWLLPNSHQGVALRHDAGVAHLPALFVEANIRLDRVVLPIRRADVGAGTLRRGVVRKFD